MYLEYSINLRKKYKYVQFTILIFILDCIMEE